MADRRYYTEGSSARQLNYTDRTRHRHDGRYENRSTGHDETYVGGSAAPARAPQPERRRRPDSHLTEDNRRRLAAKKAETKAVTNAQIRYTVGMVAAIVVAVALCCYLLKLISDVRVAKNTVADLKEQVAAQLDENTGYSAGLDSMVDLNEIYDIATTKLGMVYSKPGQTLYYSQNSDDYVIQYKDVPEVK